MNFEDMTKATIRIPLMPNLQAAKTAAQYEYMFASDDEFAMRVKRFIQDKIRRQYMVYDTAYGYPDLIDTQFSEIESGVLVVVAYFQEPKAAMLFKLTHGGDE